MNYEKLSKKEATALKKKLRNQQGNLAEASRKTGLQPNTIKRAADGLTILPDSMELIKKLIIQ